MPSTASSHQRHSVFRLSVHPCVQDILQTACENFTKFTTTMQLGTEMNFELIWFWGQKVKSQVTGRPNMVKRALRILKVTGSKVSVADNLSGESILVDGLTLRIIRLGLSHWDPYAMHRGGCLVFYHCNMVEWSRWDSGLICKTNWFP